MKTQTNKSFSFNLNSSDPFFCENKDTNIFRRQFTTKHQHHLATCRRNSKQTTLTFVYLEWRTATCCGSACSHESSALHTEQSRSSGGASWSCQPTSRTRGFHLASSLTTGDKLKTCVMKRKNIKKRMFRLANGHRSLHPSRNASIFPFEPDDLFYLTTSQWQEMWLHFYLSSEIIS